jgi:hypothetical protein
MNADAHEISGLDAGDVRRLERLIDNCGIAKSLRGRCGKDVEPARGDDGRAE